MTTPNPTPTSIQLTDTGAAESADRDRLRLLQVIEDAEREVRSCPCGALMTVGASDDTLWLECPAYRETHDGRLAWLRTGLRGMLHDRRTIVDGLGRVA